MESYHFPQNLKKHDVEKWCCNFMDPVTLVDVEDDQYLYYVLFTSYDYRRNLITLRAKYIILILFHTSTGPYFILLQYVKGPRAGPGPRGPRAPGILPPLPPPLWTALNVPMVQLPLLPTTRWESEEEETRRQSEKMEKTTSTRRGRSQEAEGEASQAQEEEKRLAEKKKTEEERRVREAEEKKQREIEEKRRRLEEAEKKRQAMMAALK
ncbi:unnamed protein product, partial [Nesidiocoris tenuis]